MKNPAHANRSVVPVPGSKFGKKIKPQKQSITPNIYHKDIRTQREKHTKKSSAKIYDTENPPIRFFYGLLSALTLIAGMVIYLLFRDVNNMVIFSWIPKPQFLKTILVPLQPSIYTDILRYNIPDMLWFVSAILFLRFIWFCAGIFINYCFHSCSL